MKKLPLLFFITLTLLGSAQDFTKKLKDDPTGRRNYESRLMVDPSTGRVPKNIHAKELKYVLSTKAELVNSVRPSYAQKATTNSPWDVRGPFNVGGRTRALRYDARDENIILAGGTVGGLFRTTDGGGSWTRVTDPLENPSITALVQDPTNQDTWYYGTGELFNSVNTNADREGLYIGDGLFKSTDNGITWTQLPNAAPENDILFTVGAREEWQICFDVIVDPINGAILATNKQGLYRSEDGGDTWTQLLNAQILQINDFNHVDVQQINATERVFYATMHNNGIDRGIFRSEDGINWVDITTPSVFSGIDFSRTEIDISPSNPDIAWFLGFDGANGINYLLKYEQSTTTWTDLSTNLPDIGGPVGSYDSQGSFDIAIAIKPDDENTILVAGTNLYRSTDGFATQLNAANTGNATWVGGYSPINDISIYPQHHPDIHELVFSPTNPNVVLCGHDGGISITQDITTSFTQLVPVSWTFLNNGYFTTQGYALSIDPLAVETDAIVVGYQDNGTWITQNDSPTAIWQKIFSGDGAWNAITPGGEKIYLSAQNGVTVRLNKVDPALSGIVTPAGATGQLFINPFILDKNNPDIMYYAGGTTIWRNSDLSTVPVVFEPTSVNWTQLSNSQTTGGGISALDVTLSNRLYYGTSTGQILRIDNANTADEQATDISIPNTSSVSYVSSLSVFPGSTDTVLATFSNYSIVSIFYTTDGGTTWQDISGNLEENVDGSGNGPSVRWIHPHLTSNGEVIYFVGTTTGLYSTTELDGTNTVWTQESTEEIGNVPVLMIKSRPVDNLVALVTHGKGNFSAVVPGTIIASTTDNAVSANRLQVYPNPVQDLLSINLALEKVIDIAKAEIYTLEGVLVEEALVYPVGNGNYSTKIATSTLKEGLYTVKVITPNQVFDQVITIVR